MKETKRVVSFQAQLVDESGNSHTVDAREEIIDKYYSIRKLNIKVCYMDLIEAQSKVCNSSKDILLFGDLFRKLNRDNRLEINISKFCRDNNHSRTRVTLMLKKSVECGFAIKEDRGLYFINPFIIRGMSFRSNESFEQAQLEWESIHSD